MADDGQMQGLRIVAESIHDLSSIRRRFAKGLRLACNGGADASRLFELLAPFRNGSCPIIVEYRNRGVGGELELPEAWRVNPDDQLIKRAPRLARAGERPHCLLSAGWRPWPGRHGLWRHRDFLLL